MGFNVSLYVIHDRFAAEVQEVLKLKPTGETEEFPELSACGATTPQGSYILCFNDRALNSEELMQPILQSSRVLACTVNETCMVSSAYEMNRGIETWTVLHDPANGIEHLEASGDLPEVYNIIRDEKLVDQQHDDEGLVDHIFDVPVELFVALGGIRYNMDLESDDPEPWHVLAKTSQPKKRWWPFS